MKYAVELLSARNAHDLTGKIETFVNTLPVGRVRWIATTYGSAIFYAHIVYVKP